MAIKARVSGDAPAADWASTNQAVSAALPATIRPRYSGTATWRRNCSRLGQVRGGSANALRSTGRPRPCSHQPGEACVASPASCVSWSNMFATSVSLLPLRRDSFSMARSVESCVSSRSARNRADCCIVRIKRLD